jgi:glycine C-acetyltransferase
MISTKNLLKKYFSTKASQKLTEICKQTITEIKSAGTYKREKQITSPQNIEITVNGKTMLNFCANNYLGLSNNPELISAAKAALDNRGYGMSSVRFICGTQDIHKTLEKSISQFHSMEDAILYASCFDANAGFFEAILTEKDAIISDALNHASIIDGIRLCKAKRFRYKHLDLADLEEQLKQAEGAGARLKFVVTDGVFSMDGDIAPLDKIVQIAQKYEANLFLDECHSTGFIGKTGRGTPELFGVTEYIDVVNSTLGKALGGGIGGYTTGKKELIDLLRQKSRPYLYSNSLVPSIVQASIKVFEILTNSSNLVQKLKNNTDLFRLNMKRLGFNILGSDGCPITPVLLKDEKLANEFAEKMAQEGIYVVGFSYPVVPKGQARIRVQLSAAHEEEHIHKAISAFEKIGKEYNII